jgi:hypothetical protein
MKINQRLLVDTPLLQHLPAREDEDAIDEVLPQNRIVQPPLLLKRQQRIGLLNGTRKHALTIVPGHALVVRHGVTLREVSRGAR